MTPREVQQAAAAVVESVATYNEIAASEMVMAGLRMESRDHALASALSKRIAAAILALVVEDDAGGSVETWESINAWCDDTFGPATVPKIIERAKEEFVELEADDADHAIEAADVVICLCRIPGFAEALQRKMAINRGRKWRTTGDGTGYHIPTTPTATEIDNG